MISVRDLLSLEPLSRVRVVAGAAGLDREVRWVHIWPEILPWIHGGELLLTTAYSWPAEPREQRRIVRELEQTRVAAVLFAAGRFFPRVPRAVLDAARRASLPVLEAPFDVSFSELTEVINQEIIRRQYEVIERSDWIHTRLTSVALEATELGDICRALAELIAKPVLVVDADGSVLGWGRPDGDPAPVEVSPLPRARLLEIRRARGPLRVADGAGERIVCPIRLGGEAAGYLQILAGRDAASDLDRRAAEHGAVVAGLHILRQQTVASVEARVQNSFVQALIRGEFGPATGLEERARLLGFNPHGAYVVGLLALLGEEARKRALTGPADFQLRERLDRAMRRALGEEGLPPFLGYLMNLVVVLLPGGFGARDVQATVQRLWRRVRELEPPIACALAMGGVQVGAAGVARSFQEADSALAASTGEGVFWYDDLLVTRLLRAVGDSRVLREFHQATLGRLDGERTREPLRRTVRELVRHGFNQRAAGRALGLHWNTMRHRIARLEALLERPLRDPELRLRLELALEIERLLDGGEAPATRSG
jgi:purine catabolism regulator